MYKLQVVLLVWTVEFKDAVRRLQDRAEEGMAR